MNFIELVFILSWSGVVVGQCSSKTRVRLVGGTRNGEGRLEVLGSSGNWSSVCPDGWAARSAGVACQELCGERKYATSMPAKGRFGAITNPISIFDTKCAGYETSLVDCQHVDQPWRNCYEDTAVGICCHSGCDGRNMFLAPRLRYAARCDWESYTVTVQKPQAGPDGSVRPFYLYPYNAPDCSNQETNANATHNWITVKYGGDCAVTNDTSESPLFKYNQKVLMKGVSVGPSISRFYQFLLPVTCGVNKNTNKTIWLDSSPPQGDTDNLPPLNGSLSVDMVIKVYKDEDFKQQLSTPIRLPVGTKIFVELSVDKVRLNSGGAAKIIVEKCVAFPYLNDPNPNNKLVIIQDKLAVEDSTIMYRSPALNKVRFKLQTFKITNNKEVYLSCSGSVCPLSDNSTLCNDSAANDQHLPGASKAAGPSAAPSSGGSISVVSDGYDVPDPMLKKKPVFDKDDFPELGSDDEVRIGANGKCYKISDDGRMIRISLYCKRKQSSFATTTDDPIRNQCLNQSCDLDKF